ncbi:hypothetical protein ACR75N_04680 [Parabacteroides merdae]|uniref:hypothetical protein n=1 Tax=Parabacteroides merdae TaxID=46503 RepID=UPI003DA64EA0
MKSINQKLIIVAIVCGLLSFVPNLIGLIGSFVGYIILFILGYRWNKEAPEKS